MVVSILGVQFTSKHLREDEKKLSLCNNFRCFKIFMHGQSPNGLKYAIITLSTAYFFVHAIEKCCQLFLLKEKTGLCFLLNRSNKVLK